MTNEGHVPMQRRAQRKEQSPLAGEDTEAVGTERGKKKGVNQVGFVPQGLSDRRDGKGAEKCLVVGREAQAGRGRMRGGPSSLPFPNSNGGALGRGNECPPE